LAAAQETKDILVECLYSDIECDILGVTSIGKKFAVIVTLCVDETIQPFWTALSQFCHKVTKRTFKSHREYQNLKIIYRKYYRESE
jgi:hypothetical protein